MTDAYLELRSLQPELVEVLGRDVEPQRAKAVSLECLTHHVAAIQRIGSKRRGRQRVDLDLRAERKRFHAAGERGSCRREYVTRVKRWQRSVAVDLLGIKRDCQANPASAVGGWQEYAVVRPYEPGAVDGDDAQVASAAANAGVYDDQVYGLRNLIYASCGGSSALADVKRWNLVPEVNNARQRTSTIDDGVAHAHPCVSEPEVGDEADDGNHVRLLDELSPKESSVLYYGSTRVTEVSLFGFRGQRSVAPLVLILVFSALLIGCSSQGPAFVDSGASYSKTSVMKLAEGIDTSQFASTPSTDAAGLRHEALTALRSRGGRAAAVADMLTRTFSADTRGVPVYLERATFDGKPSVVVIEAAGPPSGKLTAKRVWVLDEQGGVLFVGGG